MDSKIHFLASIIVFLQLAKNVIGISSGLTIEIRVSSLEDDMLFYAEFAFGKPPQQQYLQIDTGSDVIWTQSDECTTCFTQTSTKFNRTASRSIMEVTGNDPSCVNPFEVSNGGHECSYTFDYGDNSQTIGTPYRDFIWFPGNFWPGEVKILFGLSKVTTPPTIFDSNAISGIVGLTPSRYSLISQLSNYFSMTFSICLNVAYGYLKMGKDAPFPDETFQRMVYNLNVPEIFSEHYAVELSGISVENERLDLGVLDFNNDVVILDIGTTKTKIITSLYSKIITKLDNYFISHQYQVIDNPPIKKHCYGYIGKGSPNVAVRLPELQLHFRSGDEGDEASITYKELFKVDEVLFTICVELEEGNDEYSQLGAQQQLETLFVYDALDSYIHFKESNCMN